MVSKAYLRAVCAFALLATTVVFTTRVSGASVSAVTVTPAVVPVPKNPTQKTAVLVSAAVDGVVAGATVSCTFTLTSQPSGVVIATSPAVSTSPAPSSGTTSTAVQMLVPGSAATGRAQATANCGSASGSAPFRITSVVGLSVAPLNVPAGGVATASVMIAGGGPLPATACTLIVTDPSGSAPPMAVQTVTVSGGTSTVPATTLVTITLPGTAPLGTANASVSCPLSGAGTLGDSSDFTVVDPSVVTVTGVAATVVAGSALSVTVITLPGFVCVAQLQPAAGGRITSAPATADATGAVAVTLSVPAGTAAGAASLTVACSDPTNAANTASSTAETITVATSAPLPAASCTGLAGAAGTTGSAPVANPGGAYSGTAGQPLQFSAAASLPSTGAVLTTCVWDFGDGGRGTGLTPTHTYVAAGTFTVSLTVSDSTGRTATAATSATISPLVPLCAPPALSSIGGVVPCSAASACASGWSPSSCLSPCQTYVPASQPGADVCPQPGITVHANAGGPYTGQAGTPINFQGTAGASGTRRLCAADATLGEAGPVCNLAPAVDLPNPVLYVWDFGDGGFADGASASHSYTGSGTYRVTLTVQFDDGSIAVGATQAQIASAPAALSTTGSSASDSGSP